MPKTYLFSATENAFYPYELRESYEAAGTWPEKGINVDESVFFEFTQNVPDGKMRGSDKKGNPVWVDVPPLTHEKAVAAAEAKKQYLLSEASEAIAPLQDAVDLDMATPEEEALLKEWKKYRVLLNRVDTSLAPDIEWPVKPQSSF